MRCHFNRIKNIWNNTSARWLELFVYSWRKKKRIIAVILYTDTRRRGIADVAFPLTSTFSLVHVLFLPQLNVQKEQWSRPLVGCWITSLVITLQPHFCTSGFSFIATGAKSCVAFRHCCCRLQPCQYGYYYLGKCWQPFTVIGILIWCNVAA